MKGWGVKYSLLINFLNSSAKKRIIENGIKTSHIHIGSGEDLFIHKV